MKTRRTSRILLFRRLICLVAALAAFFMYEGDMTEYELAYLAGIVDGEGCITFQQLTNGNIAPGLYIGNTNFALMQWLLDHCGGHVSPMKVRGNRKPGYMWYARRSEIPKVLRLILPYMVLKREQAEIMLSFYDEPNNNALQRIRELNRKGPATAEECESAVGYSTLALSF
jgi:hypothetical protein